MKITTIGVHLAKTSFSVHSVDAHGKAVLRKTMSRGKFLEFMTNLEPCLVGMEACGGAHDLARRLIAMGHEARLMAARFVQPYRKNQKNDGNDAEAICEAVARPATPPGHGLPAPRTTGIQYTPVDSRSTTSSPHPSSQPASALRSSVIAPNSRTGASVLCSGTATQWLDAHVHRRRVRKHLVFSLAHRHGLPHY
jgi:hypothetical protein